MKKLKKLKKFTKIYKPDNRIPQILDLIGGLQEAGYSIKDFRGKRIRLIHNETGKLIRMDGGIRSSKG